MATALILAAGMGTRMGGVSKAKIELSGVPALMRTLAAFDNAKTVDSAVISAKKEDIPWIAENIAKYKIKMPCKITEGGATRQQSAQKAFAACDNADFVAFHDGARCLVTPEGIDKVVSEAISFGAAVAAVKLTDTVKLAENGIISKTVDREKLYTVQTPQVFSAELYKKAAEKACGDLTDDCGLCENIGAEIRLVDIGMENIKLTVKEDIPLAEAILKSRGVGMLSVGHGYDAHRLTEGRKLILGGVEIPYEKGLDGHSDADVLLHALMDAMLGACALGDIGKHFPPSDNTYKDISSMTLLEKTNNILAENGFSVSNLDATVVAQQPKLSAYIEAMRKNIADALKLDISKVSVKATTEEKMGFTGSGEGISAHAVCLTVKNI